MFRRTDRPRHLGAVARAGRRTSATAGAGRCERGLAQSRQRPSNAAQANHLRFALSLANRAAAGENPYPNADWKGSWSVQQVTDAEWERLRAELRREYENALKAAFPQFDETTITGIMALAAHSMYHLGAIRQLYLAR